jgi:hypothetical protein
MIGKLAVSIAAPMPSRIWAKFQEIGIGLVAHFGPERLRGGREENECSAILAGLHKGKAPAGLLALLLLLDART